MKFRTILCDRDCQAHDAVGEGESAAAACFAALPTLEEEGFDRSWSGRIEFSDPAGYYLSGTLPVTASEVIAMGQMERLRLAVAYDRAYKAGRSHKGDGILPRTCPDCGGYDTTGTRMGGSPSCRCAKVR